MSFNPCWLKPCWLKFLVRAPWAPILPAFRALLHSRIYIISFVSSRPRCLLPQAQAQADAPRAPLRDSLSWREQIERRQKDASDPKCAIWPRRLQRAPCSKQSRPFSPASPMGDASQQRGGGDQPQELDLSGDASSPGAGAFDVDDEDDNDLDADGSVTIKAAQKMFRAHLAPTTRMAWAHGRELKRLKETMNFDFRNFKTTIEAGVGEFNTRVTVEDDLAAARAEMTSTQHDPRREINVLKGAPSRAQTATPRSTTSTAGEGDVDSRPGRISTIYAQGATSSGRRAPRRSESARKGAPGRELQGRHFPAV
eukprot:1373377-Pyramimonas_sp.AAC.3